MNCVPRLFRAQYLNNVEVAQAQMVLEKKRTYAILVIAIIAASMLLFGVQAQAAPSSGTVFGTGTVTCPSGTVLMGQKIQFNFNIVGFPNSWIIFLPSSPFQDGKLNAGHVNLHNYRLTGFGVLDTLCGAPIADKVTINGDCGLAVPIALKADNGETASFTGDVTCTG